MIRKFKVVLVEDNQPTVQEFQELFAKLPSFEIIGVADGATNALEIIKNDLPSVVIVDISLREGDGIELVENIISGEHLPFEPCIVVITAIQKEEIREKLYKIGVDYIFGKEEVNFSAGLIAEFLIEIQEDLPRAQSSDDA